MVAGQSNVLWVGRFSIQRADLRLVGPAAMVL
jgi:hypothetical protein